MTDKDARIAELEAENERLRQELNEMTGLMLKGEALRQDLMLKAVLAGVFSTEVDTTSTKV